MISTYSVFIFLVEFGYFHVQRIAGYGNGTNRYRRFSAKASKGEEDIEHTQKTRF